MVERGFNKLENSRRLATRYEQTADRAIGIFDVACIELSLRYLPG